MYNGKACLKDFASKRVLSLTKKLFKCVLDVEWEIKKK